MFSNYPGNGLYVVQGEISSLMTSMKKVHWSTRSYQEDENNPLLKNLAELKVVLNQISDLKEIELMTFLRPFLDVIRSKETSVQVTVLALSSVNKFISYGLIGGISEKYLLSVIENVADAVAHANFVITDHSSDAVILMKIVEVLRNLVLSPLGCQLSNDSVCEIMLSCFKICFETRLNELLRHSAEHCLKDIVQLLFSRLPLFNEASLDMTSGNYTKMRMRSKSIDSNQKKKKKQVPRNGKSILKQYNSKSSKEETRENTTVVKKNESFANDPTENGTRNTASPETVLNKDVEPNISEKSVITEEVISEAADIQSFNESVIQPSVSVEPISSFPEDSHFRSEISDAPNLSSLEPEKQYQLQPELEQQMQFQPEPEKQIPLQSEPEKQIPLQSEPEKQIPLQSEPEKQIPSSLDTENNLESPNESSQPLKQDIVEEGVDKQYVNSQGVRFMSDDPNLEDWLIAERVPLQPHNIICVQDLLKFLAMLCDPYDNQNTDVMIQIGLSLLTVALEVGAKSTAKHASLLLIVEDILCRNLLSLLNSKNLHIFTATLHVSFLLFESMRDHLKFQMEYFLSRLSEIIVSDNIKVTYDKKELALESLVRLWSLPGLVTELFLNYDCDLYCLNLYEEITKLLSKNVYPVSGIYSTNLLSLDALLTIVDSIEKHCHSRISKTILDSIEKHCHSRISNEKIVYDQNLDNPVEIEADESSETKPVADEKNIPSEEKRNSLCNVPSHEELMAIKRKKKLLATGTEHFNANPKKGIQYLQEQGLLSSPLESAEVATFLRENPHLDKKMIGDYISNRTNLQIKEQYVKSFDFTEMRIDEALRLYLEAFRLPGEAPLISSVMQEFADHWHKCNNEPFSSSDVAYVLAYAIIMLNVDQHNMIVRRQNAPMTVEDFKKNFKGTKEEKDLDPEMLEEIYLSIKNEEIVLPAEHVGRVRENYLWKLLLRRGKGKDGLYIRARDGLYDHQLFSLCWGPVVTALSYVFDKATDSSVYYKSVQGFRKCATISAHYGMSNEFDNLTLSLCKFTMLLSPLENPESFTISFGMNSKARLAARTLFSLVHRHGDILREGWRHVFDCIFQLFRCRLLPKILVEAEDFLELSGKVSLVREDVTSQKTMESGLLSSLYRYITSASENSSQRTEEEQECVEVAKTCITDCHLENLILESKFLRLESLHELLKVLIKAYYNADGVIILDTKQDEDKAIFFLELLLKVVIQNRDRVSSLWQSVCDHLYNVLMTSAVAEQQFLIERCVIGLLRLAIRLMRREEISSSVLQSLQMLFLLKWSVLSSVSRQISYGLHELLKTGAANIHSEADWAVIFTLLEVVGAGAPLPKASQNTTNTNPLNDGKSSEDTNTEGAAEDSGLGCEKQYYSSSDSSLAQINSSSAPSPSESYQFLNGCEDDRGSRQFYSCDDLLPHDPFSLVKCCESLAFLVRDVAHITPFNFENCVHTIRTFVEATMYPGESRAGKKKNITANKARSRSKTTSGLKKKFSGPKNHSNPYDADESDPEEYPDAYYQVPLQLLDLMHTLHTRTAQIHKWWAEENAETELKSLWPQGWCPLLQGIARLCCDPRKSVRMSAITYLQRALLMHDLQTLTAGEWESCFSNVLFPLLEKLSQPIPAKDVDGVEETRMRAATLLSKVFLHHLSPLQLLPSFTNLWLKILDFMDCYMNIDKNSDLLNEAIQESVKNMILVMESAKLFFDEEGQSPFWISTWERVDKFLPNLRNELFRHHSTVHESSDQSQLPGASKQSEKIREQKPPKSSQEDYADSKNVDVSLIKHSIPIFPHMGQLISTPIGPPIAKNDDIKTEIEQNKSNVHQISSLVASAPEFLASLPSFRPQSPPFEHSKSLVGSPSLEIKSIAELLPVTQSPSVICPSSCHVESPSTVSLPNYQSLNANEFAGMKRSSSCDATAGVQTFPSNSSEASQSFGPCTYVQIPEPMLSEHAGPMFFPKNDIVDVQNGRTTSSVDEVMLSPSKSTVPVFSGFTQLNSNVINLEENNAKQFFYW